MSPERRIQFEWNSERNLYIYQTGYKMRFLSRMYIPFKVFFFCNH